MLHQPAIHRPAAPVPRTAVDRTSVPTDRSMDVLQYTTAFLAIVVALLLAVAR